ncbi:MAG: LpqB family beta-propeller domain-containing protein [Streptosporangiaceae bacterium]
MSRRFSASLLALLAAGALAGCATMPASGRVTVRDDHNQHEPFDDPYLRILPVKPQQGWSPDEVVNGFLTAMASFDDDHSALKDYLATGVRWNPGLRPKVTVLDEVQVPVADTKEGDTSTVVQISGKKLGMILESGQYSAEDEKTFSESFTLKLVSPGRWRIAEAPESLLLKQSDVERAFRTINLYFFAPDERVLVPDSVFLPLVNKSDLPSQLVKSLLEGATPWLNPAVKTFFPRGTRLKGDRVRVENETATVDLTREAATGPIKQMSAQLMWTLKQLTDIKQLRLEIDGRLQRPNDKDAQEPGDWQAFDPDMSTSGTATRAYMIDGGRLASYNGIDSQRVTSFESTPLLTPAVSLTAEQAAGVSPDGRQLIVGRLDSARPRPALTVPKGSRLLRPSWDRAGNLWIVENKPTGSALWLLRPGQVQAVQQEWTGLSGYRLQAIRVARDGVRVAVLVTADNKNEIRIGRIDPTSAVEPLSGFRPINASLASLTDLAWLNADTLAVLGSADAPDTVAPYEVPISGGSAIQIGSTGLNGLPKTISASAPNQPILLGLDSAAKGPKFQVCSQKISEEDSRFSSWELCKPGSAPTYPG